jgi:hypothetical protein
MGSTQISNAHVSKREKSRMKKMWGPLSESGNEYNCFRFVVSSSDYYIKRDENDMMITNTVGNMPGSI